MVEPTQGPHIAINDGDCWWVSQSPNIQDGGLAALRFLGSHRSAEVEANARLFASAFEFRNTLRTIQARLDGVWDDPELRKIGPLSDLETDIRRILERIKKS